MRISVAAAILALLATTPLDAQSPPAIQGTLALKGTMTRFYRALNALVVTTADGVEHVYHFTATLLVHGSKAPKDVARLRPGTTVIVHYRITGTEEAAEEIDTVGDQGLKMVDGRVTRLDVARREMVLQFPNGTTETFRLTDRAASELDDTLRAGGVNEVTVYYTEESGSRLVHYFGRRP